jgi:hypothetical protein
VVSLTAAGIAGQGHAWAFSSTLTKELFSSNVQDLDYNFFFTLPDPDRRLICLEGVQITCDVRLGLEHWADRIAWGQRLRLLIGT